MNFQGADLDTTIEVIGIAWEVALVALLTYRRVYRSLPFFYAYLIWCLVSDSTMVILQHLAPSHYLQIFAVEVGLDSTLQYAVLVELAWSVLRPFRTSLPRWTVAAIAILILGMVGAVWPFSNAHAFSVFTPLFHFLMRMQMTFSIMRVLIFAILAGGSHLLSIGWRDRELQVATGLGGYSLVSLAAAVIHSYPKAFHVFHPVDLVVSASYLVSMFYWTFCFAQKEAPRHEFTPQMQGVLAALARTARTERAKLTS